MEGEGRLKGRWQGGGGEVEGKVAGGRRGG